ncbi:DNA polymerase I [Candidatus Saccharibacteria bacterium]|nr:DNA polymerase I [Candidatus Saccharibacteria bacterium]MBP9985964.1 DNA polymerase I [Candidatus Saccharibacteria bacterium]
MKKLAIIDGKSVFYRGYYAMPNLSTSNGTPTGGVFGFVSLSIELIKKLKPDYVAVAWDKKGTNIQKRKDIYPDYKAGRKPAPPDFYEQIPILHELLNAFGWPLYEIDGYEADDIMATFSREASEKGISTDLITSDLDALQALGPNVQVYALKNGLSNLEKFDVKSFEEKYGIKVNQFLDYKSLVGDSSDNIPGVAGIGKKTAAMLLEEYGTLENIYNNLNNIKPTIAKKLEANKNNAFMSKKVATLFFDVPINLDWAVADINDINLQKVAQILKKLEFSSLVNRLPDYMDVNISHEPSIVENDVDLKNYDGNIIFLNEKNELIISSEKNKIKTIKTENILDEIIKLKNEKIVGHNLKELYHNLTEIPQLKSLADFSKNHLDFNKPFDLNQAEFLINPLRRNRSLESLFGDYSPKNNIETANMMRVLYNRQMKFFEDNLKIKYIAEELDFKLIYQLFKMEKLGIKIDKKMFSKLNKQMSAEQQNIEQEIYKLIGHEFNIASPSQLSQVLFDELNLPTAGIKKVKMGYSTGQKELDKLRGLSPIIELIEKSREVSKLKNTYVDVLPNLADKKDRIHTTFNQDVTATGRLSSTNPNLQNIPVRTVQGRQIRAAFVPAEGNVFVNADYSQFELRLAAVLANDTGLINDFNNDVDIHTKTASEVYGVPLEEVSDAQRRNAKVINFGVLYGMSPHGLSVATGMTMAEAKDFIDQYFKLRQKIRSYIDLTLNKAREEGFVETFYGRKRPTPDLKSSNYMVRSAAERAAANMPIQGTEADLMKRAMLEIEKILTPEEGNQLLQIHDSILIETPKEKAEIVGEKLKNVMENIAPELKVKLKADVKIGNSWEMV